MNIKKYLLGATLPAYINYTPITTTSSRATAAASSSSEKSEDKDSKGISDKDLVKALDSLEGLPNEILEITREVQNFLLDLSMSLGEVDSAKMSMRYAALVGKIKIAKFNAEQFKNADKLIRSNGGINEIAIDTDGFIYCLNRQDPSDFERFTPEEYLEHYKEYKAMSNQLLLYLRSQSPGLINNNEILLVVNNGMGIEKIQEIINNAIHKLGTTLLQEQGYSQTQLAQIAKGLEYIEEAAQNSGQDPINGMQVDGIYNLSVLSKDLLAQAQKALTYLYGILPKNAKALLTIKAAENGIPGGAMGLITSLIQSKMDVTLTEKLSRSNNPADKKNSGKTEIRLGVNSEFAKLGLTPTMMAQLGMGERKVLPMVQGTKYEASAYALAVPLVSKGGEALGSATTLLEVSKSQLAGALNMEDATMGGARIDPTAAGKVAITGGNMYIMNVPIDKNRPDSVIAPDLKYLKRLEEADKAIEVWKKRNPGKEITAAEINRIYKEHDLPVLMNDAGEIIATNYCKFAVFNGEVKDSYLIPPPDGSSIIALDISTESNIQNYKDILSGNKETKNQEEFDENNWYDFNGHDTLYRSTVFIPLNSNVLSGAMTSGASLTVNDAVGIEELNQQKQRLSNYDANAASKYE